MIIKKLGLIVDHTFYIGTTQTYAGDYEDLDDHLERTKDDEMDKDICSEMFDTIGHLRNELFVFLGSRMWRFSGRGSLQPGYPAPSTQMFHFPTVIKKIDAVYERPDGKILFFSDDNFWISTGNSFTGILIGFEYAMFTLF